MILKQFHEESPRPAYLIGDRETGLGILFDPRPDVDPYLEEAAACGLVVRHAFATNGARPLLPLIELQDRTGAYLHRSASAPVLFRVNPLLPGTRMTIGRLRVELEGEGDEERFVVYHLGLDGDADSDPVLVLRAPERARAEARTAKRLEA